MLYHLLATLLVAATPQYHLDMPAQVLALKDGTLLVTERGTHDRVLRVNPATGRTTVFERGIDDPWGLGYARDGTILLSSRSGLYRIRSGARPARIAAVNASPFAALPDGRIAYANETSVGLLARGRAHPLPVQVSIPHGLALLPDGTIAVSDTGNNRILRIGLSGETTVITARVSNALGLLAEPGGTLLTVEYGSGRLLRTDPAGTITVVARGLHKPYALTRAASGAVFVTESTGTIRRILPSGLSSVVPLKQPGLRAPDTKVKRGRAR